MFCGIDIGGSYIKVVWSSGKKEKIKNPQNFERIKKIVEDIASSSEAFGLAVAGFVNFSNYVEKSPNIPSLDGVHLDFSHLGKRYFVGNDATLASLGEVMYGAGRDFKYGIVVCLTLGTGLGGGLTINSEPFFGSCGVSMEIGHIRVGGKRRCTCGRIGCAEEFVSKRAIERYYYEISGKKLSSEDIISLANKGDEKAIKSLKIFSKWCAITIQNISHILSPHLIIISGGIITHFKKLIDFIKEETRKVVIKTMFDNLDIRVGELGDFSAAFGALEMAKKSLETR